MASSSQTESVRNLGPTVIFEPKDGKAIADIVFVHGLQGHPKNTWTSKSVATEGANSTKTESKKKPSKGFKLWSRKGSLNASAAKSADDLEKPNTFWPYHLLPDDCKNVRILTWGYNSNVSEFFKGSANKGTILSHSRDLLGDLTGDRLGSSDNRQLIFVAHSLGGIIVKAMLLRASQSKRDREREICEFTNAILFLGTPHRGGNFVNLGETVRRIVSATGFDTAHQNIRDLAIDSATLEDYHERFLNLDDSKKFEIRTFQEGRGMKGTSVLGLNDKVVDDVSSACRGTEPRFAIDANHMEMCRYSSKEDDGYRKVSRELRMLCEDIENDFKEKEASKQQELNITQLAYLDSLAFQEMNFRQEDVLDARADSCTWILEHQNYQKWLKDDHGLLWIQGKPGSGKSTLMKRIFQVFRSGKPTSGKIHLAFFFHRRGVQLQHSPLGMFRTMLHQLLSQVPATRADFLSLCEEKRRFQGDNTKDWVWREPELCKLLQSCLITAAKTHSIVIFIDALDEAGEDQARYIVSYLHEVNEKLFQAKHTTSICFACRHYPIVRTHKGIKICVEDENFNDISAYAHFELRRQIHPRDEDSGSDQLNQLQEQISKKASGVFLWVNLVISTMAKQYNDGRSLEEILVGLEKAPSDLKTIFQHILGLIDPKFRRQTLHLMEWICLAERPLSVTELRFALAMDDSSIHSYQEYARESKGFIESDNRMKILTVSLSGGLVEVKISRERRYGLENEVQIVQFIHQSVNDFLIKDGFAWLNQESIVNAIGLGHDCITKSCINYLKLGEVERAAGSVSLQRRALEADLPFLRYSAESWFLHAEKAENLNVPQKDLVWRFQLPTGRCFPYWIKFLRIINQYGARRPREKTTLMHVAAASNLKSIVASLLDSGTPCEVKDAEDYTALHDAALWGHKQIVSALLNAGADVNARTYEKRTPLECAGARGYTEVVRLLLESGVEVNQETGHSGSALQSAASRGMLVTVNLLLNRGADINAQGGCYGNALQAGASSGSETIVKLLLDRGADINAQGGLYGNALQAGASSKSETIVELLLDRGAIINAQGGDYGNALQAGAYSKSETIVELLLNRGANINAQGGDYGNALQAGAYSGSETIVELLLDRGANISIKGGRYGTALQAGAYSKSETIVELLLDRGADINAQGGDYGNALQAGAYSGSETIVELLLDRGADINAQGGDYGTALQAAAVSSGSETIVGLLLDRGADINAQGGDYGNALQAGAYSGSETIVELLLDRGADINAQGGDYGTALQAAAVSSKSETIFELLLDRGADINAQGGLYGTALQAAAVSSGSETIVELLLDRGADINAQGGHFGTALQAAASSGSETMVELLLDRGADINTQGGYYGTALHAAAHEKNETLVKLLLDRGADINKKDSQGRSAVHLILVGADAGMAKYSLSLGTRIDWTNTDQQGCSALHLAASDGSADAVKLILSSGDDIDINLSDSQGWTPLHWACRNGNADTVQVIFDSGGDLQNETLQSWTPLDVATFCGKSSLVSLLSRLQLLNNKDIKRKILAPGHHHLVDCSSCFHEIYGIIYQCDDCKTIEVNLCFRCIGDATIIHESSHLFRPIEE